jgi:hypothetical protein
MNYVLKHKYGVDEHCALVGVRSNHAFLTNQKDIIYSSLLLDEDIHNRYKDDILDMNYLKWLEKEFGIPNLWPYLGVDRILMHGQFLRLYPHDKSPYSYKELLKILQVTAKAIIAFLDKEKPDFIFFPTIGSLSPLLLYEIARKKGIPAFLGQNSRFKQGYLIIDDPKFTMLHERFVKIQNKSITPDAKLMHKAEDLLYEYQKTPQAYDEKAAPEKQRIRRSKQLEFLLPTKISYSLLSFYNTVKGYYVGAQKNDYTQIRPWFYLIDRVQKKMRALIGYDDLYDPMDDQEDFAYFALSVEPELNLLFFSPFATDQINIIKNIARALPIHYKLYVKEHPYMTGCRTRKFYKEIKKMPNIKLIHPGVRSFELIKKAKLVATINGTTGWEAVLFKKPVITFGNAFYNSLSTVMYCKSMHDLPNMAKHQLESFQYKKDELINFITALLEDTGWVDMLSLWEYRERDFDTKQMAAAVEPLVDILAKKLNLTPIT